MVDAKSFAATARPIPGGGPPARSRGRRLLLQFGPPAAVFGVFIGIWYLVAEVVLSDDQKFLVPPPHRVVEVAFFQWENLHELLDGLWLSTEVAALGLLIAIVFGGALGMMMAQAQWVERSLYPWVVVLQCIPILAIVPLIGFLFGFSFRSRVLVCVLIALFPIVANTLFGLRSVDIGMLDLFRLQGVGRFTVLRKLQFPAALPSIFVGLRISAGLSVIGALVGDDFFKQGTPGLGILIDLYRSRLQSEQLYGAIILGSALGVLVFWGFGLLGKLVVGSWDPSYRKR